MSDLDLYDYELPADQIAQSPPEIRGASRALFVTRHGADSEVAPFSALIDHLVGDECLVVNDTRVIPARVRARRASGGRVEVFCLRAEDPPSDRSAGPEVWHAWVSPARRVHPGESLTPEADERATIEVLERCGSFWRVRFDGLELLERIGDVPVPPYIARDPSDAALAALDRERYQTVFADRPGAVAAPTAGLHFTPELLGRIAERGVPLVRVTLHVGPGTFQPIRASRLADHVVAPEPCSVTPEARATLAMARRDGRRVVAVGTTTVRVLESLPDLESEEAHIGEANLTILPGHTFRHVDGLVTNFHLPKSSLLVLVAAFHGRETTLAHYRRAVREGLRFYSYGDAMVILPERTRG